jgi:hypothetical protein
VAVSGDACLGLRRFAKAGRASVNLKPLEKDTVFLDAAFVRGQRAAHKQTADEAHDCASFRAVTVRSEQSKTYDEEGIASFVCRHGVVLVMCSLFGPETHCEYELMVHALLEAYDSNNGREINLFFMDIACKFWPWLEL